jgi:DNA repair protein RecO (recombination protein O)
MKQFVTLAIILRRTDYGEADRILTLLTPGYGKLSLLAKGVRRIKSKLAGGIELFSVSEITFIRGRGEVGTLVSTRLIKHYAKIVGDLDRTMLGYGLIKQMHKATEDEPEEEYFDLLREAFEALNDLSVPLDVIQLWFMAGMLRLGGHAPNLQTDTNGQKLAADQAYQFSFEQMSFTPLPGGPYTADHLKFLRLAFAGHSAETLGRVQGSDQLTKTCLSAVQTMLHTFVRV